MTLEIITPEYEVFKGEVSALRLPGLDGYFGLLNNHAPMLASLKKGTLKLSLTSKEVQFDAANPKVIHQFSNQNKTLEIEINGGTVEVLNSKVIVLAE